VVKGQNYVYFGTGSLLGVTDQKRTQTESVYGIHDTLASADNTTNLRSVLNPFVTTTTNFSTTCAPNANCNVINASGFVVDLSGAAEQVLLTPTLVNSTLTIVTNLPNDPTLGACGSGGNSNVYYINAADGTSMGDGKALGVSAVGLTYVNSGEGLAYLYARGAGGRGGSAGDWGVDATGSSGGSTYSIPSGDAAKTLVPNGSATASGVSRTSWRAIHQ
jgi:Tfp pilus tip-associated adhesin PilY1